MSTAPISTGSETPSDILELQAAEQRRRMHNTLTELRTTVAEKTDVVKITRNHLWPAAGVAAVLGLVLGYGIGGMFVP